MTKASSVYELVHYLKGRLDSDNDIQNILVSGEISNFTNHSSGHLYFSLKDDKARISCVMFKGYANSLNFKPKNGDRVIVRAKTSIFEASGQMQLYISQMKIDGIGDLYLKYESLKKKLYNEGLFLNEHKKMSPKYPFRIAVLVGDKSAALSDIKTVFKRRWPVALYDVLPCLVQGEGSSKDIISKLLKVDNMNYDAIILARGGGSIEDLWSFNDEELARTIYNLKTFIVCGVGHEQDYTIADFVSDLRAPTPTAAVELITPNIVDVRMSLDSFYNRIINAVCDDYKVCKLSYNKAYNNLIIAKNHKFNTSDLKNEINTNLKRIDNSLKNRLSARRSILNYQSNNLIKAKDSRFNFNNNYNKVILNERYIRNDVANKFDVSVERFRNYYDRLLKSEYHIIDINYQKIDYLNFELKQYKTITYDLDKKIEILNNRMIVAFKMNLTNKSNIIETYNKELLSNIKNIISYQKNYIENNKKLLRAYSKESILKRGFTQSYKNNKLLNSINDIVIGDEIDVIFKDGMLRTVVKEIQK